jgi:hypothetical protein
MNRKTNIYRDPKYKWVDLVQFDRARDGGYTTTYGWSQTGDANGTGNNRPLGARLVRSGSVLESGLAWTDQSISGQYLQFSNLTQSGDKLQIKYDPSKIVRFWYRYSGISQLLFDTSNCPLLTELSFRRNYGLVFGDLDLSGSPLLERFEITYTSSINSVTFHPSAPLEFVDVKNTSVSGTVIDTLMAQCVAGGVYNGTFSNSVNNTAAGCNDAETLIARGWTISTYVGCGDTEAPTVGFLSIDGTPSPGQFDVSWTASSDNVGVTKHTILYKKQSDSIYSIFTTYPNGNAGSTTITGLDLNTAYHVKLRAEDAAGNYTDDKAQAGTTTATAPTLSISPTYKFVEKDGGSFILNITTTASWTLSDDASWLSATATSGSGNTAVTINYAPNAGAFRLGRITVSITGDTKYCDVDQASGDGGFE